MSNQSFEMDFISKGNEYKAKIIRKKCMPKGKFLMKFKLIHPRNNNMWVKNYKDMSDLDYYTNKDSPMYTEWNLVKEVRK